MDFNQQHSILPPSSTARRVACPGSRLLEAKYPQDQNSEYAREGEAAHWVASEMLKSPDAKTNFYEGQIARNGEIVTEEMVEGAKLYVDKIYETVSYLSNFSDISQIHIEEKIEMPNIHPESWGTPDAWLNSATNIYIWDYKFGHGFVEVFENWQLIAYAAGILNKLKINGVQDQHISIHMTIVQPRSYHKDGNVRTWTIKASDLRPYFNILSSKENEAMQSQALCIPNPECTYCTARHACMALQQSSLKALDTSRMNLPNDLSDNSLGNELRYLKKACELLDARITGLEEQAIAKIKAGNRIPFYRLEQSVGHARWKQMDEEVITMGVFYGLDLAKPPKAITPKQAEKKGMSPDAIKHLVEIPKGAMKLVEDNAKKIFKEK